MASVTIDPDVLRWAISESGVSVKELSERVDADVEAWLRRKSKPSVSELRAVANTLKRPFATFFLPNPPALQTPTVQFRHPADDPRTSLNPDERKTIREAMRQQRLLSWLVDQLDGTTVEMPTFNLSSTSAERAARALRQWIGVSPEQQLKWSSSAVALRSWRAALEEHGIVVFSLPMGSDSIRGFSIWEERLPIIAINSAWNYEARIFSMFHELGHLVTKTSSACVQQATKLGAATDPAERWCEQFAAHLLMPADLLREVLNSVGWVAGRKITDLAVTARVARRLRVSLRAAVLKLIDAQVSGWDLYKAIPPAIDEKKSGGRPADEPRNRARIRRDQFGRRATSLYFRGVRAEVLDRTDVIDYLDVPDHDLDELQAWAEGTANG